MKTSVKLTIAAGMTGLFAAAAGADVITGAITADNHYALYSQTGVNFAYHGGNEIGSGGSPGTYNWSLPESYEFRAGDKLYIAAWSDDAVAQGVLAEFHSTGLGTILSGDPRWQVYATNINRGDGDAHPGIAEIAGHVAVADTFDLWESPFVGDPNGVSPWGYIPGISEGARWMWKTSAEDADPLHGGSGAGEMLIFRTTVPTPGSLALLGVGGVMIARRRR